MPFRHTTLTCIISTSEMDPAITHNQLQRTTPTLSTSKWASYGLTGLFVTIHNFIAVMPSFLTTSLPTSSTSSASPTSPSTPQHKPSKSPSPHQSKRSPRPDTCSRSVSLEVFRLLLGHETRPETKSMCLR